MANVDPALYFFAEIFPITVENLKVINDSDKQNSDPEPVDDFYGHP